MQLTEHGRLQVDSPLAVMAALEAQVAAVDAELRRFARTDERCQALQAIYGVGPILAGHLVAEIGEASRFRRAEQITRLAGLDPVVEDSGATRRRGKLAKAGSPHPRWALVEAAVHAHRATAPDPPLYRTTSQRRDATIARLTEARKIGKRAYHVLRELELAAADDEQGSTSSFRYLSRPATGSSLGMSRPQCRPIRQPARDHRAPR